MNKIQDNTAQTNPEIDQAKAVAQLLDQHAQRLSMRTLKRLEDARISAVSAHAAKIAGHQVNRDGTLSHWFSWTEHPRIVGASLVCAALVIGLTITIHNINMNENSDAFLLGAELPPEAFVDRGFEPWLNADAETQVKSL
jgi:hypothetical protein